MKEAVRSKKQLEHRCDARKRRIEQVWLDVDISRWPALAKGEQIVAVPTLIKERPQPARRFIGSMMDKERLLAGLDLVPRSP